MTTGAQTSSPAGARIVFDEDRRGWLIQVGPEPGRALLRPERVIDSRKEAEDLLRLRGYRRSSGNASAWPWRRIDEVTDPGKAPCVEDWLRPPTSEVLTFPGDET